MAWILERVSAQSPGALLLLGHILPLYVCMMIPESELVHVCICMYVGR